MKTELHRAALVGDVAEIERLVAEHPQHVFEHDEHGDTPKDVAVANAHYEAACHLRDYMIGIRSKDDKPITAPELSAIFATRPPETSRFKITLSDLSLITANSAVRGLYTWYIHKNFTGEKWVESRE